MEFINSFEQPENNNLISFEGIDGCGKSTQIELLKTYLDKNDYNVLCLREPGGTKFGEKLRQAILESTEKLSPSAEAFLFASSRAQLLEELVLPFISKSRRNICILDRYIHSSLAYQGFARSLGTEKIINIHNTYPLNVIPNITFYLDITVKTSTKRQENRNQKKDYFEKEKLKFFEKLIDGYNASENLIPNKFKKINGELDKSEIHKRIVQDFENMKR